MITNKKSFSDSSKMKISKEKKINELNQGVVTRLLEKYKPNKGMSKEVRRRRSHDQIKAA
tara:strand:+ start:263 stop:442 length:180 start_codon:yes stop_codon:yes gene_type:complete